MSKFMDLTIDFLAYDSTTPSNDPEDGDRIKKKISETKISAFQRSNPLAIPNATTDLNVPLPAGTNNYLLLFTDQTISIKLNGDSTAMILRPIVAAKKTPVFLMRGDITSLTVSNASGAIANLDIIAVKI